MQKFLVTMLLLLLTLSGTAFAVDGYSLEIETEGSYQVAAGSSIDMAKKLALFNAKIKAVESAGRYLSHAHLIKIYERDKDEIYSLATREIATEILDEKWEAGKRSRIYRVKIRARIQTSDFIKAEMENAAFIKMEAHPSYQEELGQPVGIAFDPGKDISKAYRLLRKKQWRMAGIYLNHLGEKYPDWDRIYLAKAITHYFCNDLVNMKKVLTKACHLGNSIACDDQRNIKKVREKDFGLSIFE